MELEGCWRRIDHLIGFGLVVIGSWWMANMAWSVYAMDAAGTVFDGGSSVEVAWDGAGETGASKDSDTMAGEISLS